MRGRQVLCPSCGTILEVPPGCCNCIVRCGQCRHRFRLPRRIAVTDDAVASWLTRESDAEELPDHVADESASVGEASEITGRTAVLPAVTEGIRLIKLEGPTALLEFPASQLRVPAFRCALPRCCLRCGTRVHLRAHVVIYTARLVGSVSLEAEHAAGRLSLSGEEAKNFTHQQLLERLPCVPNVPSPGDLPMPYWLCDMCSGADMISGQIHVNTETGTGWCRLLIRNLHRAEEFLAAIGSVGTSDYRDIQHHLATVAENPWDTLPLLVQHRVEGWFKLAAKERFIAYVPDRDRTRTEDGMSGLVVSTRRLLYHTPLQHKEMSVTHPLELQLSMIGIKGNLSIETPDWEVKHFTVDRDSANQLRRALAVAKFHANWR